MDYTWRTKESAPNQSHWHPACYNRIQASQWTGTSPTTIYDLAQFQATQLLSTEIPLQKIYGDFLANSLKGDSISKEELSTLEPQEGALPELSNWYPSTMHHAQHQWPPNHLWPVHQMDSQPNYDPTYYEEHYQESKREKFLGSQDGQTSTQFNHLGSSDQTTDVKQEEYVIFLKGVPLKARNRQLVEVFKRLCTFKRVFTSRNGMQDPTKIGYLKLEDHSQYEKVLKLGHIFFMKHKISFEPISKTQMKRARVRLPTTTREEDSKAEQSKHGSNPQEEARARLGALSKRCKSGMMSCPVQGMPSNQRLLHIRGDSHIVQVGPGVKHPNLKAVALRSIYLNHAEDNLRFNRRDK
jgi:hypothetical protein